MWRSSLKFVLFRKVEMRRVTKVGRPVSIHNAIPRRFQRKVPVKGSEKYDNVLPELLYSAQPFEYLSDRSDIDIRYLVDDVGVNQHNLKKKRD